MEVEAAYSPELRVATVRIASAESIDRRGEWEHRLQQPMIRSKRIEARIKRICTLRLLSVLCSVFCRFTDVLSACPPTQDSS